MPPTAEIPGNLTDIDLRHTTPGNEINPFLHTGKGKQNIQVFHDHKMPDQQSKFIHVFFKSDLGYCDINSLDGIIYCRFYEVV